VLASFYGIISVYFVSLHVTTRIKSYSSLVYSSLDGGSLTTKSSVIDFHGRSSVLGDNICPYGACRAALFRMHVS
jgi:hypothetical protein